MANHINSIYLLTCVFHITLITSLPPSEDLNLNRTVASSSESSTSNQTQIQQNDAKTSNVTDSLTAESASRQQKFNLPITMKPRGFNLPKNRPAQSRQDPAQPAAQNYYSTFFSNLPSSGHSRPYFPLNEESLLAKLLAQQHKQYEPSQPSQAPFDTSILGSGDFGILKGGTFYPDEETPYSNEEASDFYYGEASNAHSGPSTERFIQKYTYPEEQFAQFRDFADLSTPSDSAYSQYVVVYAAKNSTRNEVKNTKPKNIFEQLQEIDKERALEEKKLKKQQNTPSITKLKLVKTKLTKKKWIKKLQPKIIDDDPLIALS